MIIKCRICTGNGQVMVAPLSIQTKPCPACRGAGEFEIQIPKERLTSCKHCAGRGIVQQSPFDLVGQVCSSCKGIGLLERPVVGTLSTHKPASNLAPTPRPTEAEYHVAISYASEDREIVWPYVQELVKRKLRVFYEGFDQSDLWGRDLYDTLDAIYRLKAQYCVLFLSRHYAEKLWTNHERKAAQARAVQENREYTHQLHKQTPRSPATP